MIEAEGCILHSSGASPVTFGKLTVSVPQPQGWFYTAKLTLLATARTSVHPKPGYRADIRYQHRRVDLRRLEASLIDNATVDGCLYNPKRWCSYAVIPKPIRGLAWGALVLRTRVIQPKTGFWPPTLGFGLRLFILPSLERG